MPSCKEVRMHTKALVAFLIVLMLSPFALVAGGDKESSAPIVEAAGNEVSAGAGWGFSWRFAGEEIELIVTAPTTGWVAIGFNPSKMMKDAQYILGYVQGGQLYLRDDFGTGNTSHASDDTIGGSQHVRPIGGTEENGSTTITFALPIKAGDAYDIDFPQGELYTVLLAYGANNADNFTGMHRKRTSMEVKLQ